MRGSAFIRTAGAALALALATGVLVASPAAAYDNAPCGARYYIPAAGQDAQYCPLWRGSVPVYDLGNNVIVGYLWNGGWANWFAEQCQFPENDYSLNGARNNWWAWTMADNGQWGWVSEVYFSGGDNYEADGGLYTSCPH